MPRIQLALNVDNLDQAIAFYSTLFNTTPAKRKPGYANFAITEPPMKLVLLENTGQGGTINHLGVEVETSEQVHNEIARLSRAGLFTEEQIATTCCFATQDKVWVTGPNAERWEIYTVLADTENFGAAPEFATGDAEAVQACCSTGPQAANEPVVGKTVAERTCCRTAAETTNDPIVSEAIADRACCDTGVATEGSYCNSDAKTAASGVSCGN